MKQYSGYWEMGSAYRKIGRFSYVFAFLDEVHPDFLEGLGDQPELYFFYCGGCKVFDDEALSMFKQFPNLTGIDLFAPTFTGSGLPPLENLESIVIADATNLSDAFFEKLEGCPNLEEVDIQTMSRSFDFEKAKILLSTHPTIQKANLDCWDGSFTWERSAVP